jgi:hypothetical protein
MTLSTFVNLTDTALEATSLLLPVPSSQVTVPNVGEPASLNETHQIWSKGVERRILFLLNNFRIGLGAFVLFSQLYHLTLEILKYSHNAKTIPSFWQILG